MSKNISIVPGNGKSLREEIAELRGNLKKMELLNQQHLQGLIFLQQQQERMNQLMTQILSVLTAGGMSSRLFHEIREKRNLAYSVKGDSEISEDFAYNLIYVGTTKEKIEDVKKIILNEFKKITKTLPEKELNEIKEQMVGQHQISTEDSQSHMVNLLLYEILGNANDFSDFEKNINGVKVKDVQEIAEKAIKEHSFFVLMPN